MSGKYALRVVLLLALFVSLAAAQEPPRRDVTFVSASDCHYREADRPDCMNKADRQTLAAINAIAGSPWPEELGGDAIAAPRGVVVLGDVIDNGDKLVGRRECNAEQFAFFLADFGLDGTDGFLKYPVFEGWGNHDGPPEGAGKTGFNFRAELKKRNQARKEKGLIANVSENGLHYSWDWDDVHFVQLNLYPADKQREGVPYSPVWHNPQGSLSFLKADLAVKVGTSGRPVVLMSHCGFDTDWWSEDDWKDLYAAVKAYNVVLYLYGHSGAGIASYAPEGETKKLTCINDGQLESGFFIIQIAGDRVRAAFRVKDGQVQSKDGDAERKWNGKWTWRFPLEKNIVQADVALADRTREMLRDLKNQVETGQLPSEAKSTEVSKMLRALLEGENSRDRHEALIMIRDLWGSPDWLPMVGATLDRMLQQPAVGWDQAATRIVACEILGKYPDERSIPVLIRALGDPFWHHFTTVGPGGHVNHDYRTIWWEADAALRKVTHACPIDAPATHVAPETGKREKTFLAWTAWRREHSPLSLTLTPDKGTKFVLGEVGEAVFTIKNQSDKGIKVGCLIPLTNRDEEIVSLSSSVYGDVRSDAHADCFRFYRMRQQPTGMAFHIGFLLPGQEVGVRTACRPLFATEQFRVEYVQSERKYDGTPRSLSPLRPYIASGSPDQQGGEQIYEPFDAQRWLAICTADPIVLQPGPGAPKRTILLPNADDGVGQEASCSEIIEVTVPWRDKDGAFLGEKALAAAARITGAQPDELRIVYSKALGGYVVTRADGCWLLTSPDQSQPGVPLPHIPAELLKDVDCRPDVRVRIGDKQEGFGPDAHPSGRMLWDKFPIEYGDGMYTRGEFIRISKGNLLEFLQAVGIRNGSLAIRAYFFRNRYFTLTVSQNTGTTPKAKSEIVPAGHPSTPPVESQEASPVEP